MLGGPMAIGILVGFVVLTLGYLVYMMSVWIGGSPTDDWDGNPGL